MKRKSYSVFLLLLSIHYHAFADAFPKSPRALGGPVLSLELLGSYEYGFKGKGSFLLWGGGAAIFNIRIPFCL